jgi:hypothetical protein
MTANLTLAYRLCVGVGLAAAIVAAVATQAAASDPSTLSALHALLDSVPLIPAQYWSQGSTFPDLSAVYFFLAWPVFPAVLGAFVTRFWIPDDRESLDGREIKMGFGSLLLIAVGAGSLWAMDGIEVMGVPIGRSLPNLLAFGWGHFALSGALTGVGVIGLRRCLVV